eukprot:294440_1
MSAGIPAVAEAKTKITGSFTFDANQQWTTTTKKDFTQSYTFEPKETGIYEVGMIVHVVKDQKLPFKAKIVLSVQMDNDKDKKYDGEQIKNIFINNGFEGNIIKINKHSVEASIS